MVTIKIEKEELKILLRNAFIAGQVYQEDWQNEQVEEVEEITELDFQKWCEQLDILNN